jgi:O-acetylhomoserine/O-acetylserine sulfhydrylase-like pyridoxal-dependent enzyme
MCDEASGFDTKCLHGGWSGDPATMAKGVPVYRTGALMQRPRPSYLRWAYVYVLLQPPR